MGEGDFLPAEMRLSHIDRDQPIFMLIGGQDASQRLEDIVLFTAFVGKPLHNAASAIAASLRLRTIAIDDLDIMIGAGCLGIMDGHDLVKRGCLIACQTDCSGRRDMIAASAHIGNYDFVAESVHLGEDSLAHCWFRVLSISERLWSAFRSDLIRSALRLICFKAHLSPKTVSHFSGCALYGGKAHKLPVPARFWLHWYWLTIFRNCRLLKNCVLPAPF
ncbi:hypothetical protein FQZ97_753950 [compost metagenome]